MLETSEIWQVYGSTPPRYTQTIRVYKKKQLGTPNSNGKTEYDHDLRLSCLKMVIRSSYWQPIASVFRCFSSTDTCRSLRVKTMTFCMVKFVDLRFPSSSGSMFFWEGEISGMLQRGNSVFYSEFCCVTWNNLYWWIHSFMNQSKPAPSISPWGWSNTWGSMVNHPICRGYTQFNEGHVGICHCYGSYISHHLAVIHHHSSLGWNLYWTVELTTQTRENYAWLFCNPRVHFVTTSIWLRNYSPSPRKIMNEGHHQRNEK